MSRKPTIYLITPDCDSFFSKQIYRGVSDMANLTGYDFIWDAPTQKSAEGQTALLKKAIEKRADAIMLSAVDPVKENLIIEEAKANSIKIIYLDTPANEAGNIMLSCNHYLSGRTAAKVMLCELNRQHKTGGFIGIVGITPTTPITAAREKGFRDMFKEIPSYHLLPSKYAVDHDVFGEWLTLSLLQKYSHVVGLLGLNSNATLGIGKAICSFETPITGIGFDLMTHQRELLFNGALHAILLQNPYTLGYLGMSETLLCLHGCLSLQSKMQGVTPLPSAIDTSVQVLKLQDFYA